MDVGSSTFGASFASPDALGGCRHALHSCAVSGITLCGPSLLGAHDSSLRAFCTDVSSSLARPSRPPMPTPVGVGIVCVSRRRLDLRCRKGPSYTHCSVPVSPRAAPLMGAHDSSLRVPPRHACELDILLYPHVPLNPSLE